MSANDGAAGGEAPDFWQNHSRNYLEMAFGHQRRQRLSNPDGYGKKTGDCGDTVEMFLTIRGGRIAAVSYDTDGCLNTNACANSVAELVEGKAPAKAWELSPDQVIAHLQTLPTGHRHCAELAVGALYLALADHERLCRQPWKKAYRKT
jgi:nitrogen fixation NifU-like protein